MVLPADDLYLVSADPGYVSGNFSVTLNLVEPRLLTIDEQDDSAVAVSTTTADEVWAYDGTAGQIVDVTLTTTDPDQFDPEVALLDAEGGLPTDGNGDRLTARISSFFLPKTGTYYIQAGPARNSTPYTLTLRTVSPPSLTLSVAEDASLNQATLWLLDANPGQIISASVVTSATQTPALLELLTGSGENLTSGQTDWGTGATSITGFFLPGVGPYYVRVSGLDGQTPYSLPRRSDRASGPGTRAVRSFHCQRGGPLDLRWTAWSDHQRHARHQRHGGPADLRHPVGPRLMAEVGNSGRGHQCGHDLRVCPV